jgi:hypothetical protein
MAKFGLMSMNEPSKTVHEFEGEFLEVQGDIVSVMGQSNAGYKACHVIRLHPGQVVKKIADK